MADSQDRNELRRNWRRNWLDVLHELADAEFQRRTWLDPMRYPYHSYRELKATYFDDLVLTDGYAYNLRIGLLSEAEARAVADLHKLLSRHQAPAGDETNNAAVLSDPAWKMIVDEANRARQRLLDVLVDPEEMRVLMTGAPASPDQLRQQSARISRKRWFAWFAVAALPLAGWLWLARELEIDSCLDRGGRWHGPWNTCEGARNGRCICPVRAAGDCLA